MTRRVTGKRIVLATFGSPGDLRPFLAIGRELHNRGHDIVVATSAIYLDRVTSAGLGFAPVRPNRRPGQQDPDFFDRLLRDRQPPAAIFREMFLPSLRDSLTDMIAAVQGADGIVAHTLAASGRLAADVTGTPWVSAVMQPMGYFSAFEPPVIGPPGIMAVLRRAGPGPTRQVLRVARWVSDGWAGEWRDLRAELDLPPSDDHPLWEGQHAPARSLGLFPRLLGLPQPDWPAQARVTGYPFFGAPGETLDPDLASFLAEGEAPVVFTLGTTAVNDPGPFYDVSLEAARTSGRRAVLLGVSREQIGSLGGIVFAAPYAPHRLLFPHAAAIVHQGGIGTLSEALRAGKPMLIMPYAHDQADNAWRASRLGVACVLPRWRYRPAAVRHALGTIIDDGATAAACQVVARRMARESGVERAADMIENVFGG